jgi:ADP-ribosylglycohydrolase
VIHLNSKSNLVTELKEMALINYDIYDRVLGCLVTAGMGDAMGAPSEAMSRTEIIEEFGGPITTFLDPSDNLYAKGNMLGEVTDDASQMYEMAKSVVKTHGNLTVKAATEAIINWSKSYPKYYPRNAGPTTSLVIKDLIAGKDPVEIGQIGRTYGRGTSNGAAMRVAAAGLCCPNDLDTAIETAITMSKPSHGTQHAYAGASAIACGISKAMTANSDIFSILKACVYGAENGERIGLAEARVASGPSIFTKLLKAIEISISSHDMEEAIVKLENEIGNDGSIQDSVSAAIGIFAAAEGDPAKTILGGANIGGDTDTIACIAGSLAGAFSGFSKLPKEWYMIFKSANPKLDFESVASELAKIAEEKMNK